MTATGAEAVPADFFQQSTAQLRSGDAAGAALFFCSFTQNGDWVHISSTPPTAASGHGWWVNGDCNATLADVTVQLQIYKNGGWKNVGAVGKKRVYSGGGSANRAAARVPCYSADPATAQDAYSVCQARLALMGWDTTFSTMPGSRIEPFGLLEAELADRGSDELALFRVQPTQPAAVHRYLPILGVAVHETLTRLGEPVVNVVQADIAAAPPDAQSLPYLLGTLNWFRASRPGDGTSAALLCEGPSAAQQQNGLERLAGVAMAPFAVDEGHSTIQLPDWTIQAATWALAAVCAAMRAEGLTDDLRVGLRSV